MTTAKTSFSASIRQQWNQLKGTREGRVAFSRSVGQLAPYSATIGAEVLEIRPGYAKIQMEDRQNVRNHLNSLHAVALANLAEMTSGLAMLYGAPADSRAIITRLSIEYLKKARGTITSECRCQAPESNERREYEFQISLTDEAGEEVAKAAVQWLVGPERVKA